MWPFSKKKTERRKKSHDEIRKEVDETSKRITELVAEIKNSTTNTGEKTNGEFT